MEEARWKYNKALVVGGWGWRVMKSRKRDRRLCIDYLYECDRAMLQERKDINQSPISNARGLKNSSVQRINISPALVA